MSSKAAAVSDGRIAAAPEATTPQRLHLPPLDGLRALAALFVVSHHAWLQTWPGVVDPTAVPHGIWARLTGWLAFGHAAIPLFIAISGFCLMMPVVGGNGSLRGGAIRFLKRRATRILPPYFAALAFSLAMVLWLFHPDPKGSYALSLPVTWEGAGAHLLLIHNIVGNQYEINGPLWSIATEFQIYLFFPLLLAMRRRWGFRCVLLFTLILGFGVGRILTHMNIPGKTPHFLFIFALGMLAATVAMAPKEAFSRKRAIAFSSMIIVMSIAGGAVAHRVGQRDISDFFVGTATACVLVIAARYANSYLARILSARWLVWLGTFSYSLYLLHSPLQESIWEQLAAHHLTGPTGFLILLVLGTLIITAAAYCFFWLFERPFLSATSRGRLKVEVADQPVVVAHAG